MRRPFLVADGAVSLLLTAYLEAYLGEIVQDVPDCESISVTINTAGYIDVRFYDEDGDFMGGESL